MPAKAGIQGRRALRFVLDALDARLRGNDGDFGRSWKGIIAAVLLAAATPSAKAAERAGVALPDTASLYGTELRLNGIALRTYSWFGIHIYVAGLYLQHPSHNAEAILDSPEKKLLVFRFVHNVDAGHARQSWREGFEQNCRAPCRLSPADVARFLAGVPAMRAGDRSAFTFLPGRLTVTVNGQVFGTITDAHFARAVLATFLGPRPSSERVKQELLGNSG